MGIVDGMCDDRISTPTAGDGGLDAARRDQIVQLFARAWRRVQQRTGRSWEKKRDRWLELLGSSPGSVAPPAVTPNQLRVALNNLVTFAQLPSTDTAMLRQEIHADYQTVRNLAIEALSAASRA
ncbi:MAG TPA: hypothetical protein VF306_02700 [Pirellulales bacterium]